jgi:hypothetical protein
LLLQIQPQEAMPFQGEAPRADEIMLEGSLPIDSEAAEMSLAEGADDPMAPIEGG